VQAGSDVVLSVGPLSAEREMVQAVTAAIGSAISADQLDQAVRHVLTAKIQAGLMPGPASPLGPVNPVCPAV
jgi:beta-glucosidase-like glycosyl hydrolase